MELYKEIERKFTKIEKLFTEITLLEFSNTPTDDLEKYNVELGTMIRLKLLYPKSKLYKEFVQYGFTDKDKMAIEIIKAFHAKWQ